jgi:L-glyceraldehyde 3-phosphate reductase
VGSIAFCPLAQGLLTNKYLTAIPSDSRAMKSTIPFLSEKDVTADYITKVNQLNQVALERGQSLAQMSLAWVLREGRITTALIGASRVSQVEENVAALNNLDFSTEELAKIDEILK